MTKNNKTSQQPANPAEYAGQEVQPARAVSIQVPGGMIEGELIGYRTRKSKTGEEYSGWVFQATKAVIEDRDTKSATPAAAGRYFVFNATRLDRILQEVNAGDEVRVTYLGKEKNEKPGADGTTGQHHAFSVRLLS